MDLYSAFDRGRLQPSFITGCLGNHLVMPIDIQANTSADVPPIGISGPTECIGGPSFSTTFPGKPRNQ